jgi:hypothetical protein
MCVPIEVQEAANFSEITKTAKKVGKPEILLKIWFGGDVSV